MEDTSPQAVAEKAAKDPKAAKDLKDDAAAATKSFPDHFSREGDDQMDFEGVIFSSSPVLDLSQRGLRHLGKFFKIPNLQQLHLQRNLLREIPEDFFQLLPNLTWLDLRYNKIKVLPSGIGSHKHLKTLLLERNPIKMLPVELEVSAPKMGSNDLQYPVLPLPRKGSPSENSLNDPDQEKEKADFFPPMERLDLSELRKSNAASEIWPSKEEIRRFWKLRQEIVENEQVEIQEKKLLAVELPPNLKAALNVKEKKHRKPWPAVRKRSTSFKGILPNLPSGYQNTVHANRMEDTHKAALQELQEKETVLEQRRRDKRALQEWREQTQHMRTRRELSKLQPPHSNMTFENFASRTKSYQNVTR